MATKGFFIITDISGYTEYLTRSELDHAHGILQTLFDTQLAAIQPPFLLSGFRGDAIFMYVPETSFIQPQSLVEALENFYIVFMSTLEQMQYNTSCTCRACKNMGMLDLKMCIHYGEYLLQKLADREELLGADVIVPHRMLKNSVIEKTGVHSYALFSDAAAQKLNLREYCGMIIPHSEAYEHLGEVSMCVHDLRTVWEREKEKHRIFIAADQAWTKWEGELHYPPSLIWEFLTKPALEAGFMHYDYAERTDTLGGRLGEESQMHCAHGEMHIYSKIMDWKPFEYYTMRQSVMGLNYISTRRLTPTPAGTRVEIYMGRPEEPAGPETRQLVQDAIDQSYEGLARFIEQEIAAGRVTISA